jgi:hypothetical protein
MCGHHRTSKNEQPQATNTSSLLPTPLLRRQGYFIPFTDVHLRLGEQVSRSVILSDPALGDSKNGFWEAIFVAARSLL